MMLLLPFPLSHFFFTFFSFIQLAISQLHKTFRKPSCGYFKMIKNIDDDKIIHNFSQEQSMSSNYDCVLDVLVIMVGS